MKFSDFSKLIKFRLTFLVVFSASISFLIGSKVNGVIDWGNWGLLIAGGFLVTGAANCFNEIIEKDLDKLMKRTMDRPFPSGRMNTGQGLVIGLFMGLLGTYLLGKLNLTTGYLSVFSILLYAFAYTPLKRKSPVAVFVGAIPGALPPLIGYVAAHPQIDRSLWYCSASSSCGSSRTFGPLPGFWMMITNWQASGCCQQANATEQAR